MDESAPYRNQPPFTTPKALNVRPRGVVEGRERGGARPGLAKAFTTQLGSGNPVRLISSVTYVPGDGFTFWSDGFTEDELGSQWSAASWRTEATPIYPDDPDDVDTSKNDAGNVRSALSPVIDVTNAYDVSLHIVPYDNNHHGKYQIYLRMDDTTPDVEDEGIMVELVVAGDGGHYDGTLYDYSAVTPATYAFSTGNLSEASSGYLTANVSTDTVTVYWQGTELVQQAITAAVGQRIGFGMIAEEGGVCLVDEFRIQYYKTVTDEPQELRKVLVASSNGVVSYESTSPGILTAESSNVNLQDDRPLQATEYLQKLYIADRSDVRIKGNGGNIGDGAHSTAELDDDVVPVSDWTGYNIDTDNDVCVITNHVTAASNKAYAISAVVADKVTLSPAPGDDATVTYRIERGPKIFDPSAAANSKLTLWVATSGEVPSGCKLICTWGDRIVMGGAPVAPHVWYMSAQGDPLDWDYAATGTTAAVAGTSSDAGRIGQPLTALIPYSDDYLIMACENSLHVLRGDPLKGGVIDTLSYNIGVVMMGAWCRGPAGEIIFLSRDGIYMLQPGSGQYPISLSRDKIPARLKNLDEANYTVNMAYDVDARGVHIFLTRTTTTTTTHYWFDWEKHGFWPASHRSDHEPTAIFAHSALVAVDSGVMLGGRDGYLRKYSDTQAVDDQYGFTSYVMYGPFLLGGNDYMDGMMSELAGVVDHQSYYCSWKIYTGETAQQAVNASSFDEGVWVSGFNRPVRPRMRGVYGCLQIEGYGAGGWAIDSITAVVGPVGKRRA